MLNCDCYHKEFGKEVCYGTKEREECKCNGDTIRCDFYPTKRDIAFINQKPMDILTLKSEQTDILKKSIEHNGTETELVIIMEELSELIQQVSKRYRGKNYAMHLLEEMADVYICLDELKLMTSITDHDIEVAMSVKFERIRESIQKGAPLNIDLHEHSGLLED